MYRSKKNGSEVLGMGNIWNPMIEVESVYGIREVSLSTRHLMNRRIFLTGSIDAEMANAFLSQLLYLEQESADPITIYVNSPGGEINAGLMIYDAIQGSSLQISMVCTGIAASMAAIIMAGGQKGRRYILKHSKMMIHEPQIVNGVSGSVTSIKNISESILKTREIVNGILAKHTRRDIEEINAATNFDNFMNAEEAIKFGLCDVITERINVAEI